MKRPVILFIRRAAASLAGLAFFSASGAEPPLEQKGPLEKLPLFTPETVKGWPGVESTTSASTARVKNVAQSLHWQVPVDHHGGEKAYPIGWPRFGCTFNAGPQRDWAAWDYLHAWLYVETSRKALPRHAAGLGIKFASGHADHNHRLSELEKGVWKELLIPLAPFADAGEVERLQFNISESDYNHGDTLDVFVSDLALLRHTAPTLLAFAPECAVMYADAARLPVTAQVAGVQKDTPCTLTCELRRGTEVVARLSTPVVRGAQRLVLELVGKKPAPGDYDVVATVTGNPQPVTAKLRLVESPWSSK